MSDTPSSRWHERGQPDPHETRYDCARVDLAMGKLTDDELANGVYLWGDGTHGRPALQDVIDGKAHMPIAWLTAAKDRIRWLSRRVAKLQAAIRVNHEWHINHDDYGGYPGSEMQATNLAALGDAALKTPVGWSATRREDGGIDRD